MPGLWKLRWLMTEKCDTHLSSVFHFIKRASSAGVDLLLAIIHISNIQRSPILPPGYVFLASHMWNYAGCLEENEWGFFLS